MPTKPTVSVTSVQDQASQRYLDTFHDQHKTRRFPIGRPWWGYREYAANRASENGFVGADLNRGSHEDPTQTWNAPLIPEARFFDFNYRRSMIVIRYDQMLAHDTGYYNAYYEAANRLAMEKSWAALDLGALPPYPIRAVLGDPPRSPKIAQAFMAGDRWLIGDSEEVNEELAHLLGFNKMGWKVGKKPVPATVTPDGVLQLTPAELRALIAEEVAKVQAAQPQPRPRRAHRRTKPIEVAVAQTEESAA